MEKRKSMYRELLFQRLYEHLQQLRVKEQSKWMNDYLYALSYHCSETDIFYYASTRTINHFLKSLDAIVAYNHVDDLCLDICYRHLCHACACRDGESICLQPHSQ